MMTSRHYLLLSLIYMGMSFAYDLNPSLQICSDYEMLIVNTKHCVSRCPIICQNKVCYEDGECPCDGFYQSTENGLTCSMDCLPGCKSAGGYCATRDLCLCRKGFYFNKIARRCWKRSLIHDRCLGRCLYGDCTSNGECICAEGYEQRTNGTILKHFLGQICIPKCKQNCGHHGFCLLPNMCSCRKKHHHYESDGKCHDDSLYLG